MTVRVPIKPEILTWAIVRAGFDVDTFASKQPEIQGWLTGEKEPTLKQLEDFSNKVHIPFGYLLLPEPPKEKMPIPFFRSNGNGQTQLNLNVYQTVLLIKQRQDWLHDYLKDNDYEKLPFVGRFKNGGNPKEIAADIRATLGLTEEWARKEKTFEEAQNSLVAAVENAGIIAVFNGVVENNTHRKIPVDECRGFVLVDDYAPFIFVNNDDFKSAQMFTIGHELAHIWTGHTAGFDLKTLLPANDPIERMCDSIAAEFLVPEETFLRMWRQKPSTNALARFFKVSEIVIARRALDTKAWTMAEFRAFYEEYQKREFYKKEESGNGGDFFATSKKRVSLAFAAHINEALRKSQLLYRDAYKLTNLKGDTFEKFLKLHF